MNNWSFQAVLLPDWCEQRERVATLFQLRRNLQLTPEQRLNAGARQTKASESLRHYKHLVRRKIALRAPHLLPVFDAFGTLNLRRIYGR